MFLDNSLKKAIREQGLSCSNALLLNKVEEPKIRAKLTQTAIQNNWSKRELQDALKSYRSPKNLNSQIFNPKKVRKVLENLNPESLVNTTTEDKEQLIKIMEAKIKLLKEL